MHAIILYSALEIILCIKNEAVKKRKKLIVHFDLCRFNQSGLANAVTNELVCIAQFTSQSV